MQKTKISEALDRIAKQLNFFLFSVPWLKTHLTHYFEKGNFCVKREAV